MRLLFGFFVLGLFGSDCHSVEKEGTPQCILSEFAGVWGDGEYEVEFCPRELESNMIIERPLRKSDRFTAMYFYVVDAKCQKKTCIVKTQYASDDSTVYEFYLENVGEGMIKYRSLSGKNRMMVRQ